MAPGNFNTVDLIAALFISVGAVQGLIRGLSGEMARLLGALCAFVAGALLHEPVGAWIASHTRLEDRQAQMLTYSATVITALILWALLHRLIQKLIQLALTKGFDKTAGIPAGMLRMTAFVGIVLIAFQIWPQAPFKEQTGNESFFGRRAMQLVPAVEQQLDAHNVQLPRREANESPPAQIDDQKKEEAQ